MRSSEELAKAMGWAKKDLSGCHLPHDQKEEKESVQEHSKPTECVRIVGEDQRPLCLKRQVALGLMLSVTKDLQLSLASVLVSFPGASLGNIPSCRQL